MAEGKVGKKARPVSVESTVSATAVSGESAVDLNSFAAKKTAMSGALS